MQTVEQHRVSCKKHYDEHKAYYQQRNQDRKLRFRQIVSEAKDVPCMDCGQRFPTYVMDFDHRDPEQKLYNIGSLNLSSSESALRAEIAKCDVVCSNCHRVRTHSGVGELADPPGSEPGFL